MSEELVIPPAATVAVVKPRRRKQQSERRFVDSLTVKTESGDKFKVPLNVNANKAAAQLVGAKLRAVMDKTFTYILAENVEMEPAQLKELAAAAKSVEEINKIAHSQEGEGDVSLPTTNSEIGKLAAGMVKAGIQGAVEASNNSFEEKLRKLNSLGKKQIEELKPAEKVIET